MSRIILVCLMLIMFVPLSATAKDQPATLEVRGEALLEVPADQVRLSVGVSTAAKSAETALSENSRKLKAVEAALRQAGLEPGEYSTGRFSLQPEWSPRPRNAAPDWRPEIVGYSVSNNLQLKSSRLELAGKWIAVANQAGANDIGQLAFGLAEPRQHRQEAIRQATAHALEDAHALAEAAGVKLVRVIELRLDPETSQPVVRMAQPAMVRSMALAESPPIIAPDDLQVRAGVSLRWEICD